jgi:hypothetical protein
MRIARQHQKMRLETGGLSAGLDYAAFWLLIRLVNKSWTKLHVSISTQHPQVVPTCPPGTGSEAELVRTYSNDESESVKHALSQEPNSLSGLGDVQNGDTAHHDETANECVLQSVFIPLAQQIAASIDTD